MSAEYAKRVNRSTDIRLTEEDAGKLLTIAQDTLRDDLMARRMDYYARISNESVFRGAERQLAADHSYLQTK